MEELVNHQLDWDLLRTMTSLAFSFMSTEKTILFCYDLCFLKEGGYCVGWSGVDGHVGILMALAGSHKGC